MNEQSMNTAMETMVEKGNKALEELKGYCADARKTSRDLLMRILRDNAQTEYGKKYDFANIHSVDEYKAKVPLSTYNDYAEAIEKMVKGEKNLITVYPINYYAVTSGSVDNPKNIPVSQEMQDICIKYLWQATMAIGRNYTEKVKKHNVKLGKRLITAVIKEDQVADGTDRGAVSSITYLNYKKVLPTISATPMQALFPPKGNINLKYLRTVYALRETDLEAMNSTFMTALIDLMYYIETNWELLVEDIEKGRINSSIEMPEEMRRELEAGLNPDPKRAEKLRMEFEKGFGTPIIPRIWSNLDHISAIGTGGFAVYTEKMRRYSGDIPVYFYVYGSSESIIAVATEIECMEYTLIPQGGFYEFIPADSDENDTKTFTLDELEIGKEYEIVLTTLSGFYRYRIGDVVRVVGYQGESPKICFVYRKKQMVNIAGEKTSEECVAWTVAEFEKETGTCIFDYSLYADTETLPGHYVLFMEPSEHLPKEKYGKYREIIEQKLAIANPSLGAKVKDGTLGPTDIKFLQKETYYLYRDMMILRGVSENQLKPVRVVDTPVKEKFFFGLIDNE